MINYNLCLFLIIILGIILLTCNKNNEIYGNEPKLIKVTESKQILPITFSKEIIGWMENSRNNLNSNEYPPCFSGSVNQIYDILKNNNLIIQHKVLLEVISILLCHLNSTSTNLCIQNNISERLDDLEKLGYQRGDLTWKSTVNKYVGDNISPLVFELLLRATTLIEKELETIKLPNIRKLIDEFYESTYPKIIC